MARSFNGTSNYIEHGAAVVTAVPITMACWFNIYANPTANRTFCSIGDSAADTKVYLSITGSSRLFRARTVNTAGSPAHAISGEACRIGAWQHGAGIFASSTDRRAFLNGVKTINTTSIVFGTPTVTTIGAEYTAGTRQTFMDGLIAEVAIWNVALDDAEVNLLARGYYPDQIRPGNLVSYWDLEGQYSPNELDRKGRFDATVVGAKPALADHPPMIPRTRRHRALDFVSMFPSAYTFQYARPDSDITAGGWTPSSGGDLYAMVDELVADDADRMRSNTGAADDAATLGLSDITTPEAGDVSITIRHRIGT